MRIVAVTSGAPSPRRLPSAGRLLSAAVGVIALHQLAYLLAHPGAIGRAVAAEGHGYLAPLVAVMVPAAGAVALWALICRLAAAGPGPRDAARSGDYLALFVCMEVAERVVAGQGPAQVVGEPAVWVGLALAPVFALVGRLLVGSFDRIDPTSAAVITVPVRPVLGAAPLPVLPAPSHTLVPALLRVRGPPPSLR